MAQAQIKVLLIDDDKNSINALELMLEQKCPDVEIMGMASNAKEGIGKIHSDKPDLVFLDINMPDGSGFDVIEQTLDVEYDVIFITSHSDYAIRAFETSALHYLMKPVKAEQIEEAVERYRNKQVEKKSSEKIDILRSSYRNEIPEKILLPSQKGMNVFNINDILRCESDANYTNVYFRDKSHILISKSIHFLEEVLAANNFVRIHNKHLINLKYIKKYKKGRKQYVLMSDDTEIPISESRRKYFLAELQKIARMI